MRKIHKALKLPKFRNSVEIKGKITQLQLSLGVDTHAHLLSYIKMTNQKFIKIQE